MNPEKSQTLAKIVASTWPECNCYEKAVHIYSLLIDLGIHWPEIDVMSIPVEGDPTLYQHVWISHQGEPIDPMRERLSEMIAEAERTKKLQKNNDILVAKIRVDVGSSSVYIH